MKIGNITSVEHGPKRDVVVRITEQEVFSEISDPAGVIQGETITAYEVVEERDANNLLVKLYLHTIHWDRILFYTASTPFDVALLLDELEASLGEKPRSWTKADWDSPSPSRGRASLPTERTDRVLGESAASE